MIWAVQSTGLRKAAKGRMARSSSGFSGNAGMATPSSSAASLIRTPAPPLTVMTPSVLRAG